MNKDFEIDIEGLIVREELAGVSTPNALIGATLYMMLYTVEVPGFKGKRVIKKIDRSIKKALAQFRTEYLKIHQGQEYIDLIANAKDIINHGRYVIEKAGYGTDNIQPYSILSLLSFKYPEIRDQLGVSVKHIEELHEFHNKSGIGMDSIKFLNAIIDYTNELFYK